MKILLFQLNYAANRSQDARWWLKADSCDLTAGLFEFVCGKWTGDVDINDGKVVISYTSLVKSSVSPLVSKSPEQYLM